MLQRMLDAHPDLAVVNEARFIPLARWVTEGEDVPLSSESEKIDWVLEQPRLHLLGLPEAAILETASNAASYSQFFLASSATSRRSGSRHWPETRRRCTSVGSRRSTACFRGPESSTSFGTDAMRPCPSRMGGPQDELPSTLRPLGRR